LIVGTATAFDIAEFKGRVEKIQRRMSLHGADVLIVDTSEGLAYLSGYESTVNR
jgi:Xaa-Pro aminopeptidase